MQNKIVCLLELKKRQYKQLHLFTNNEKNYIITHEFSHFIHCDSIDFSTSAPLCMPVINRKKKFFRS